MWARPGARAREWLAGCSVEDYRGPADEPIYDRELAADRVRAAAAIDFRDHGTYAYWSTVPTGMAAARAAFAD